MLLEIHMRHLSRCAFFAVSLLALGSGCFRSARADFDLTGTEGTLLFESEKDWAAMVVGDRYRILNNVWNKQATTGRYRQMIFVNESKGQPVFGWVWKWWGSSSVVAYPELQVGHSPWNGETAPNSGFPFRAGSKKLVVDYDVSMRASGSYNLAFEFWTVSSPPVTKDGITHEVMIWIAENRLGPAGNLIAKAEIGGHQFRIFLANNHGDDSGANSNTWTIISLVADKPILHGPLDIGAIVGYLVQNRLLDSNVYVACLELGNEVASGSGKTEIRNYAVRVE
jgi:cellulose 1,4-beta-cellobiosidase